MWLSKVDAWVGQVLGTLRDAKMAERTLVLVLSDHGRDAPTGRSHGGFSTTELAVQWLLAGPGVKPGRVLRSPVSIIDAAPTLLHGLGVRAPISFRGHVVHEAFVGGAWAEGRAWSAPNSSQSELALPRATPGLSDGGARFALSRFVGEWWPLALGFALGAIGGSTAMYARLVGHPNARSGSAGMRPGPQSWLSAEHPAANRLRAAAGEPGELQGLLK